MKKKVCFSCYCCYSARVLRHVFCAHILIPLFQETNSSRTFKISLYISLPTL